ncbi:MAG: hypothetical protein MJ252_24155 [archaeon]|nr:hypothetical protein [archaeon]
MEDKPEINLETSPKTIDIYQHLKLNLKNKQPICECGEVPDLYCIPCKISVCKKCTFEDHKKHILISRNPIEISPKEIDKAFKETEGLLKSSEYNIDHKAFKENLSKIVEAFSQKLIDKVLKMKKMKLDEIEHMFDGLAENTETAKKNVEAIKKALKEYYQKTHKFFNISKGENKDEFNTIFLLSYDIANIAYLKEKETKNLLQNLKEDANNYQICMDLYGKEANDEVERILFGSTTGDSLENKVYQKLELTPGIRDDVMKNDEEYNPLAHFKKQIELLRTDDYKEINDRLTKYQELIDDFKGKAVSSYQHTRNLKEIENELKLYENTKSTGAETLFSQREQNKPLESLTARSRLNTERNRTEKDLDKGGSTSRKNKGEGEEEGTELKKEDKGQMTSRSRLNTERNNRIPPINKKEDVLLNADPLKKLFAYLMMDLYGKYFKMATQMLQSSHSDLMIKVDPDEEETDYARIIENTNTLVIYEKLSHKLTKKQLKLSLNPMGYTVFPVGCRCVLIKGKVYISGGRDEKMEYPNVLIYDMKTEKLKRIMDLNEPRAFHTMMFCDVFETIMVMGGEGCASVEIFDPLTNRWQLLPPLNYPRADIAFHFDKPRGLMFALFGKEGGIVDGNYSDVIEVLDLTEFKRGWVKVEYYNKSGAALKKFLSVFPLSNCLLLAYGGETSRRAKKIGVLVDLTKFEITKINREMRQQLYFASQRSKKLSNIIGGLNLEESKAMSTIKS